MKVYIVYTQESGLDCFDLDTARVFVDRKKAEECLNAYLIGPESEGYEDARIFEYEVEE